ncbi:MFS transporter [Cohnella sp. REN36]|uniref:MFS transporter n=1 Tax=Cohnella sp. REN36 TaxID=2887347 RepID=UPI001D143BBF|nr:MFS transporter [Cohnella sp. REN36]MCC3372519.1 MFS transporter [Cohnella sp. REN36]
MRRHIVLFFLIMFLIGTDTFLISPLLPTLQHEFGMPVGIAGWMVGAYTLGSAVFALIAGPLSDGWNRRTVLLCGLLGFAVSTILCGFADGFWTMCLFRLLAGVSAAFTAPQVWASIPAVLPPARVPKAMGVAFGGLAAAQALGVPIGSWLAAGGWSAPFWAIGGGALVLAAFAFRLLPDMKPGAPRAERTSILRRYAPLLQSGKARSGFLAYLLLHLGSGTAFAFAGKWMTDRFGLSIGQLGTVMMFLGLGTLAGSMISALATRKLGAAGAVTIGMSALVALYAGMPHLGGLSGVTAAYLVINTVLGVIFPIVMAGLTSLNASIRGTISSLANATMNGANTLGAWLAGLLYVQLGGFSAIGAFAGACLVLSLGLFLAGGLLAKRGTAAGRESASSAS